MPTEMAEMLLLVMEILANEANALNLSGNTKTGQRVTQWMVMDTVLDFM